MYRLKNGVEWGDVKEVMWKLNKISMMSDDFEDYFEKVDLPVIDWTKGIIDNKHIKIQPFSTYLRVQKYNNVHSESLVVCISEHDIIKSVSEFNEKCALLFGFYLKEGIENGD